MKNKVLSTITREIIKFDFLFAILSNRNTAFVCDKPPRKSRSLTVLMFWAVPSLAIAPWCTDKDLWHDGSIQAE